MPFTGLRRLTPPTLTTAGTRTWLLAAPATIPRPILIFFGVSAQQLIR